MSFADDSDRLQTNIDAFYEALRGRIGNIEHMDDSPVEKDFVISFLQWKTQAENWLIAANKRSTVYHDVDEEAAFDELREKFRDFVKVAEAKYGVEYQDPYGETHKRATVLETLFKIVVGYYGGKIILDLLESRRKT